MVLLPNHYIPEHHKIYLHSGPKPATSGATWDTEAILKKIWIETYMLLPFAHAIPGYDTTSRLHRLGKGIALRRLRDNEKARENTSAFFRSNVSKEKTIVVEEAALSILYGGKSPDNLNSYRHRVFQEKIATSKILVHSQDLPFSSAAAKFHCFLTYLQVEDWIGLQSPAPDPGIGDGDLRTAFSILTDLPSLSKKIIILVKYGCKKFHDSEQCSCHQNGIACNIV